LLILPERILTGERLGGEDCEYCQTKESLYTGYTLANGTYLASPEKACLDILYLHCLRKRNVNTSEWMVDDLDRDELRWYAELYPPAVRKLVEEMGKIVFAGGAFGRVRDVEN
jgi:hypothetical protein